VAVEYLSDFRRFGDDIAGRIAIHMSLLVQTGLSLSSLDSQAGSAILNWGASPNDEASVAVTGQSAISSSAQCRAWLQGGGADNADQMLAGGRIQLTCGTPHAGVGFTINALSHEGFYTGQMAVQWQWNN
jgi:hypothetical protein